MPFICCLMFYFVIPVDDGLVHRRPGQNKNLKLFQVLCMNFGTPPPGAEKSTAFSKLQCWVNPDDNIGFLVNAVERVGNVRACSFPCNGYDLDLARLNFLLRLVA